MRVAALVVAAAVSVTLLLPVPVAELTVSQASSLVADHAASLSDAVTVTLCVPPPAGALQLVGETVNVADPAACVTLMVCPATVAVALRLVTEALVAAVRVTLPLPVPVAELTVSQA